MGSSLGGFVWVCECLCKRILSSQQPDVCRAIPLHNYLRTSGTSKRSERASSSSVSFSLSLIVSSSLSTLSALFLPSSSLLVFRAFFKSSPTYSLFFSPLSLSPPLHVHINFFIPPSLAVQLPCLNTCMLVSSVVLYHPCINTYNPYYFSLPAGGHLAFSPPPLSSWFCAAFTCHSFWLLSKHHLLPRRQQRQSLFAIQIVFLRRLSPGACMCCIFAA